MCQDCIQNNYVLTTYMYVHNTARFMVDMNRDGYRDQIVSMSVWLLATECVIWTYFLHSTTYTYIPFIVHEGAHEHKYLLTVPTLVSLLFLQFLLSVFVIQRIFTCKSRDTFGNQTVGLQCDASACFKVWLIDFHC